ncbi:hypothetical protein BV25DRAFT_1912232 [Artomyces pyxidatus]|uniref:Uncharacterized protein n=1 Tax=Artomyces pyxidatus TaxID=48021 RepID=A0ACB8TEM2_9AGAM|nr:hypothetical protein BV25DRAFT_1912232 [Artomyces pyxidatus]
MTTFKVLRIQAGTQLPLYTYNKNALPQYTYYKQHSLQYIWTDADARALQPVAFESQGVRRDKLPLAVTCDLEGKVEGESLRLIGVVGKCCVFRSDSFKATTETHKTIIPHLRFHIDTFGPLQFRTDFHWRIVDDESHWEVARAEAPTALEVYAIASWAEAGGGVQDLWSPNGVSVDFMRWHIPKYAWGKETWPVVKFYQDIVQSVFDTPIQYDAIQGTKHFVKYYTRFDGKDGDYLCDIDEYTHILGSVTAMFQRANCIDLSSIVRVALSFLPWFYSVKTCWLTPFGYIKPTTLKGFQSIGPCNNPFFQDARFKSEPLTSKQYSRAPTQVNWKGRSAFGLHCFISVYIPPLTYPVILDATCGPQGGLNTAPKKLTEYLSAVLETDQDTNYYITFNDRPGQAQDVVDTWRGVTLTSRFMFNVRADLTYGKVHALGPAGKAASSRDGTLAEDILEHAQVPNCDPPQWQQFDADDIANVASAATKLPLDGPVSVIPGPSTSSVHFHLASHDASNTLPVVDVSLTLASTFDNALNHLRASLSFTDAPLDHAFVPCPTPLGQHAMSARAGGWLGFVRGNCYVELRHGGQDEDDGVLLDVVATALDNALAAREVDDRTTIACPEILDVTTPAPVSAGTEFLLALRVLPAHDAAVHAISMDITVMQAVSVRTLDANAGSVEVELWANGKGSTRVELVAVNRKSMAASTRTVDVEVGE